MTANILAEYANVSLDIAKAIKMHSGDTFAFAVVIYTHRDKMNLLQFKKIAKVLTDLKDKSYSSYSWGLIARRLVPANTKF
ncbi:hypothetical protein ACH24_04620 [Francisella persica ATCC VR-331]|uniref:Uncharacterized protein n=1 Tax=Francisella persica ATCC VR-331 TaxID=1086726 RepID=A0AAC8VE33_9GAMM|nr:hypothetical protein [Francisella persica]ALB01926.1 hypothetical protein ACH24_04620 [Francisella persica ATCC VR-331]ANH77180.1 hypothetical protein FSC845_00735 [Francisella persica ATCC VR-331]